MLHEFVRKEAIYQGLDVYFFMHSDVALGETFVLRFMGVMLHFITRSSTTYDEFYTKL